MDKSEKKFPPPPRDCPSSNPTASTTRHRTPPLPQLPWWNPMPLPQGLVSAQAAPPPRPPHPLHPLLLTFTSGVLLWCLPLSGSRSHAQLQLKGTWEMQFLEWREAAQRELGGGQVSQVAISTTWYVYVFSLKIARFILDCQMNWHKICIFLSFHVSVYLSHPFFIFMVTDVFS